MPLEPLDPPLADHIDDNVVCEIANGFVHIFDVTTHHGIRVSEDDFGKLFDKWMLARLRMNQERTGNDVM